MSRRLLKQMATEWRSNLWLVIELCVVSVVLWYVADYLLLKAMTYSEPLGVETERVYRLEIAETNSLAPDYDPADTTYESHIEHRRTIFQRLEKDPAVEIAAITSYGVPNELNMYGQTLNNADANDSLTIVWSVSRKKATPGYIEMFNIRGAGGESAKTVRKEFERGKVLASSDIIFVMHPHKNCNNYNLFRAVLDERKHLDPRELTTRKFYTSDSTEVSFDMLINPMKRTAHEMYLPYAIFPYSSDEEKYGGTFLLKARPEAVDGFIGHILKNPAYRSGNMYVADMVAVDEIGMWHRAEQAREIRNHVVMMVFLLVSIFLGLLGTFWFRTQQRVGEIAIRKVNGASARNIFLRLNGEGIMLLTIATLPAIVFDWVLTNFELNQARLEAYFFEFDRFFGCVAIVYALMALMIVAGIWFPASKAMKIEPAVAIKDE